MINVKLYTLLFLCLLPLASYSITTKPDTAFVGIHMMNIHDMEMPTNTYYADFYIWFKWKGNHDPVQKMNFTNLVDLGSLSMIPSYETTQVLDDGNNYMLYRIEGRFFTIFDVKNFPIDRQIIRIEVENEEYENKHLVYEADENQSGIHDGVIIPGWNIKRIDINKGENIYNTTFGLKNGTIEIYSKLTFSIIIERPFNYFIWKLLLPLLVVLISSVSFIYFPINDFSSRFYLPIYAILTAVFLQLSYAAAIPETGYLVLMDKIYVATYLIFLLNMMHIVILSRLFVGNNYDKKILIKWDKNIVYVSLVFYLIYVLYLIFTTWVTN